MPEKRKYKRIKKKVKSLIESVDSMTYSTANNLSEGGIFISTPEPVKPGNTVDIEIYLTPEQSINLKGTVKWIRDKEEGDKKSGMGIEFISDDAKEKLKALIENK